jgi:hypothetical protein
MRKFLPVIVVLLILAPMGWWAGHRYLHMTFMSLFIKAPPEKKFMDAWEADIQHLREVKALPPGFSDLKAIKLSSTSEHLKKMFKKYPIHFGTTDKGHYTLEIYMDELEDGGVIVQYDLVEQKSGNTVWELARTFPQKITNKN